MKMNKAQKELMKQIKRDIKMVFFVRRDLKMQKGKIASQCAHASIALYKKLLKNKNNNLLDHWEKSGSKKIVLKVDNESAFGDVIIYCEKHNILNHTIIDAGKTQIEANSKTVLCIIEESKKLNNLTRNYKLM
jgi:PTH2 family peptidyl-tRNA hydrolase